MVIDELIVRKGTTNMPIDSYDNKMIDEIVYEGQSFHFAKQKDITGTTEIVADNGVQESLVSLGVKGDTFQQTYTGKNLFNIDNYNVHQLSLRFDISHLQIGQKYTFSSNKPLSWFKISIQQQGTNPVIKYDTTNGFTTFTFTMARNSAIAETSTQYLILGGLENVSASNKYGVFTDISELEGYEILIEKGSTATEYEPYVGGIPSPNPQYPQPIKNTGNNGIEVELSGVNLINLADRTMNFDGSTQLYKAINPKFALTPSTTYTLSFDYEFSNLNGTPSFDIGRGEAYYTRDTKQGIRYPNITKGTFTYTFSLPENLGVESNLFFRIRKKSAEENYTIAMSNWQLVIGSEAKPYEPYFAPTKINIPSEVTLTDGTVVPLRFAKFGDIADTLTISNGKVEYIQRIANFVYKEGITITWYNYYNNSWRERHLGVQFANSNKFKTGRAKGYCSHEPTKKLGVADGRANEVWIGINSKNDEIYWVGILDVLGFTSHIADRENITSEERTIALGLFKEWLTTQASNGNPFTVEYVIPTAQQITYDLTDTEVGQQLLALATEKGTNVLTITSEIPVSETNLSYWRQIIPNE